MEYIVSTTKRILGGILEGDNQGLNNRKTQSKKDKTSEIPAKKILEG
ncbi:MAG: hypothetical protein M3239_06960 [Thermoproteota archaeon]|nr:hypothetical protein [Thermoproteota archaeon]